MAERSVACPYKARARPHRAALCLGVVQGTPCVAPTNQALLNHTSMCLHSDCPGLWVRAWPHVAISPIPGIGLCVSACLRMSVFPKPSCSQALILMWLFVSLPGPVLVSLRPGSGLLSPWPLTPERPLSNSMASVSPQLFDQTQKLAVEDGQRPFSLLSEKVPRWAAEHRLEEKKSWVTNGFDIFECPPPKTENEV